MSAGEALHGLGLMYWADIYLTALYTSLVPVQKSIDAGSYTTVRLVSGALTLWLISSLQKNKAEPKIRGNWISAAMLFLYASAFSFAYLSLSAGAGALILFGTVQVTMVLVALRAGERPQPLEWLGLLLALRRYFFAIDPCRRHDPGRHCVGDWRPS